MTLGSCAKLSIAAVVMFGVIGSGAIATTADPEAAVKYRQGVYRVLAWNIGPLGAMAKGEIDFDPAEVQLRADRLALVAPMFIEGFPEGSSGIANTDALPKIWDNMDDFVSKAEDLSEATAQLAAAAPTLASVEDLQPLVVEVGGACKSCHDEYRAE